MTTWTTYREREILIRELIDGFIDNKITQAVTNCDCRELRSGLKLHQISPLIPNIIKFHVLHTLSSNQDIASSIDIYINLIKYLAGAIFFDIDAMNNSKGLENILSHYYVYYKDPLSIILELYTKMFRKFKISKEQTKKNVQCGALLLSSYPVMHYCAYTNDQLKTLRIISKYLPKVSIKPRRISY